MLPSGGHRYDTYIATVPENLGWLTKVARLWSPPVSRTACR
ncbi:MAG TPA: hypothetical protein VFR88_12885 [Microlunatus sp.]|nr:hypothetical protein [Microlunatus sp.]